MPVIDRTEIERRLSYYAPDDAKRAKHELAREVYKDLGNFIADAIPESREKSLAVTALEESMFWANAALARPEAK